MKVSCYRETRADANGKRGAALLAASLLALPLVAALARADNLSVSSDVGQVFTEAPGPDNVSTLSRAAYVRARAVHVNLARLRAIRDSGGGRMTLNLFDDVNFTATAEYVETLATGFSLAGPLDGIDHGRFNLVVHDQVMVGIIRAGRDGTYHLQYIADGTYVVRQIDPSAFPPCGVSSQNNRHFHELMGGPADAKLSTDTDGHARDPSRSENSSVDDGSVHDILVLYSDVTRQAAGGTAAVRAAIELAVDVANDAYAASGIASGLRLVHMEEIAYDEDTGWDGYQDHLVRLGVPDDGYFDHIHELRDRLGADFVSLIVEDTDPDLLGNGTCGLAPVMQELSPDFDVLAFSVVSRECAADNWSLAHEVGHNQGCAHNRENASVEGLFTYSYGYHLTGDTQGWSTIMAYNDADNNWQRFAQFSNPNRSHDGVATGVPIGNAGEAHNVSTINSTRVVVARFRTTRYWVDFGWSGTEHGLFDAPFAALSDGIEAVPDGGMVVIKSGSTNQGFVLRERALINSWNGSAVIGAIGP